MTLQIDLSGHIAVITGATGQLGRVMARTLASCGADVAVHYHQNASKADELCSEISSMGRRAVAVTGDVGARDGVLALHAAVRGALGDADIVVTNAVAQYSPWQPVLDEALENYEEQFRTCVMQNVLMAKAFAPAMMARGWGRIIGINTECSMQLFQNQSAYASAKRGMDGVLRVLAKEVGRHQVTVNQVAPGWTISENRPDSDAAREYAARVPLGRRGSDQEIANVVAFLASDLASFITGAFVPVCGGNVMPAI
jgi:3-oxoacyl-[acyl-carrier protein] reductase